jgi:hypothetical protein
MSAEAHKELAQLALGCGELEACETHGYVSGYELAFAKVILAAMLSDIKRLMSVCIQLDDELL